MDHFQLHDGVLHAEDVPLPAIAEAVGTPVYVYSCATLERHARVFREALAELGNSTHGAPLIAFAVKANPNLAVLKVLQRQGYGADVVSGGEMRRALAADIRPEKIVFSGVGKTARELADALDAGIGQFNLESEEEGEELAAIARGKGFTAPCALRINPDVDAGTHDKISTGKADNKFGVPIGEAEAIFARLARLDGLEMRGIALHIGSQLADLAPLEAAFGKLGALIARLRASGHAITHADLGGGLGVPYREGETLPAPAEYGAMVARVTKGWDVRLIFEPGRVIAGNAGVLLTRVIRVKRGLNHPFVVVDAAMNDLARPALYGAYHHFASVSPSGERMTANIVGPICETGDTFAMGRKCDAMGPGDLAVFRTAGAYGATMASSYNSRGFVPEVLVDGGRFAIVADRIEAGAIMDAERVPEWLDVMHSLPLFHRIAGSRVVVVGEGAMGEAKRRLVTRAGGAPCGETEAHHARLGFVALEDAQDAEAAALRLKRRGLLVNVADRPELCDFTVPSVLDRDPVLVAVSTGGASAGLAKHLRLRLEAILPQSLGRLAQALFAGREALRVRFPGADERRRALDEAFGEGGPLDPFDSASADRVGNWLAGTAVPDEARIYEFTLASDDPDDLTLRQARSLGMADTVLHDPAIPEAILTRARADALRRELPDDGGPHAGLTVILRRQF